MKKVLFLLALVFVCLSTNSQIMRAKELEKYAKENYGDKWTEAAETLGSQLSLDKNNSLTYEQIIDCGDLTKEQIYIALNYWFTATFDDANSVIKLNDKESGVIIAEGYVADIAGHAGGMNAYNISIQPIIKVDIKDKKIRVTYTIQYYDVIKASGGGIMGAMSGARSIAASEKWTLDSCYPFVEKDRHKAKKTSSKALVMAHAYSNVMMDKIEESAKNGMAGSGNDDW